MEVSIFSFPFKQIGWGLRQLSLSGSLGNFFAIVLYLLIGCIPVVVYVSLRKKGKHRTIDHILLAMPVLLLGVLYYMINPGLLPMMLIGIGEALLGGTFYSIVIGYLVLRMLLQEQRAELNDLQKSLRWVLILVMFLLAASVVVEIFVNLPTAIWNVQQGNTTNDPNYHGVVDLKMTYLCLGLSSVVNALPNALGAVGIRFCVQALDEMIVDTYSEKAVSLVKKIAVFGRKALIIVVSASMICNLFQMLCSSQLYQMHISIRIPLFGIAFLLAMHVFARYIEENQKLKEDNSLFI